MSQNGSVRDPRETLSLVDDDTIDNADIDLGKDPERSREVNITKDCIMWMESNEFQVFIICNICILLGTKFEMQKMKISTFSIPL